MKHISLLLIFLLPLLSSCNKYKRQDNIGPNNLPPITQTGANTFGCLINGKGFVPQGPPLQDSPGPFVVSGVATAVNINAVDQYHGQIRFNLGIDTSNFKMGSTFPLLQSKSGLKASSTVGFAISYSELDTLSSPGQLTIRYYDKTKGILSGTFSFDAFSKLGTKYEVRDGRFDVKF